MSRFAFWILMVCAVGLAGCADGSSSGAGTSGNPCVGGGNSPFCHAAIEVVNGMTGEHLVSQASIEIDAGNIPMGLAADITLTVGNPAAQAYAAELVIDSIGLDYEIASPKETAVQAFECYDDYGHKCDDPAVAWHKVVPPGLEDMAKHRVAQEVLHVRYTRFDTTDRVARLHIHVRNDPDIADFQVVFQTKQGKPKLVLSPATVIFGYTGPPTISTRPFKVSNVGDALLIIKCLEFNADSGFSLTGPDGQSHLPGSPLVFDPPLELENGKSIQFEVTFAPKDNAKKQGTILVMSNDPAAPNGAPVTLSAGP